MTSQIIANLKSYGHWTLAPGFCFGLIVIVSCILGSLFRTEIYKPNLQKYEVSGQTFSVAFEFGALLASAERGESLADIRLRADIYLSRVFGLRDAPVLADVRRVMPEDVLPRLFQSATDIARLTDRLDRPDGRDLLLQHLRSDAKMIREMIVEISQLDRELWIESQTKRQRTFLKYLGTIFALLMVLLAAWIFINLKLRETGRALSVQLMTLEEIMASVHAAIIGLGEHHEVLYSNRRAMALLGSSARRGSRLLGNEAGAGKLLSEIGAILHDKGCKDSDEMQVMRKIRIDDEGGTRHFVIRVSCAQHLAAPVKGGKEASLIIVVTDVTTEEEAVLRREEYDLKLGEASRFLAFAAVSGCIVHEISQPLAAMRNYAYTLKAALKLSNAGEELHLIGNDLTGEIDRAIEVVRNVRQMGPQGPQDSGSCDVHEVIKQSIRLVVLGAKPPPSISVTPARNPVMIVGSLPIVGQVVVNLLKNALSASSAAGRSGAKVDIVVGEDSTEIMIADFGSGVSEDLVKTLFTPFSKSTRGGMGLGLAICQRIATNLGGSLSWENSENAGAIFRFRVPLASEGAQV